MCSWQCRVCGVVVRYGVRCVIYCIPWWVVSNYVVCSMRRAWSGARLAVRCDAWFAVRYGVRFAVRYGVWFAVRYGVWFVVRYGVWFAVRYGVRFAVRYGVWFVVRYGVRFAVRYGVWFVVCGALRVVETFPTFSILGIR